jgi:hypothetical protein
MVTRFYLMKYNKEVYKVTPIFVYPFHPLFPILILNLIIRKISFKN